MLNNSDISPDNGDFERQYSFDKEVAAWGVGACWEDVKKHILRNGAYDLRDLESLEGRYGHNGNNKCDVLSGPCSCGAWH